MEDKAQGIDSQGQKLVNYSKQNECLEILFIALMRLGCTIFLNGFPVKLMKPILKFSLDN